MTIKNVHKVPTTYRAAQWNGEKEEEASILSLMDGAQGYCYFESNETYGNVHLVDKKGNGYDHTLTEGDWVVASSKGKLEILSEWDYAEKYEDD
jgi:hypothetical protein